MTDIIERLRSWNHGIPKTMIVSEAADEIERLRKGIQDYLDGNYSNPRQFRGSHGQCPHTRWWYEGCDECDSAHFSRLLGETITISPAECNATPSVPDASVPAQRPRE